MGSSDAGAERTRRESERYFRPSEVPVVVLASAVWDTPTPVNVHQIARRLAARGHRLLFVESTGLRAPAARAAADRARIRARLSGWLRGLREVAPQLHVLAPLALPASVPGVLGALSRRGLVFQVRRVMRRLGMDAPVIWAFLPSHVDLTQRLPGRLLAYHCVDHYAGNPGVDAAWIESVERRMLRVADLVFATSGVLAERLGRVRADVRLVPNVADVELFGRAVREPLEEPLALRPLARPRLVYVGNLAAYRVDFGLLDAVARALPEVQLVLIGALGSGDLGPLPATWQTLTQRANVSVLPPQPQRELPAFLRHCDVALIPFLDNAHTRGSLPLKLWEYLAAGLPVVATDLPNFRDLAASGRGHVARDAPGFVEACRTAMGEPASARGTRSAQAQAHGWPARMEELCAQVAQALRERSHVGTGGARHLSG